MDSPRHSSDELAEQGAYLTNGVDLVQVRDAAHGFVFVECAKEGTKHWWRVGEMLGSWRVVRREG